MLDIVKPTFVPKEAFDRVCHKIRAEAIARGFRLGEGLERRRGGSHEIEITPAMVDAGVKELDESGILENGEFRILSSVLEPVVRDIFAAMLAVSRRLVP